MSPAPTSGAGLPAGVGPDVRGRDVRMTTVSGVAVGWGLRWRSLTDHKRWRRECGSVCGTKAIGLLCDCSRDTRASLRSGEDRSTRARQARIRACPHAANRQCLATSFAAAGRPDLHVPSGLPAEVWICKRAGGGPAVRPERFVSNGSPPASRFAASMAARARTASRRWAVVCGTGPSALAPSIP